MHERVALSIQLSLGADGALPSEFLLFSAGLNRTMKGDVKYTPASKKAVASFAADLGRDLMIDYEHASLDADKAPDPAKAGEAAGWFSVDARDDGIYAVNVTWTDDAAARLKARKYRYFSPVIFRDAKTREITGVLNAALTGNPATKGQMPLVASATTTQEQPAMKILTALAAISSLKLSADATEELAAQRVEKLADEHQLLLAATGKTSVAEASAAISAWKSDAEKVQALSARLAQLESEKSKGEVLSLIKAAQAEGRVAPAQVPLLEKMGARSVDELKEFLSAAPKLTPGKEPAKEPSNGSSVVVVSDADKTVALQLGVKLDDLAKTKAAVGPVVPTSEMKKPTEA